MKTLTAILRRRRAALFLCAVFLAAQALLCLASPAILGDLLDTGVQQKGFRDALPRVMSRDVFRLFEEILPAQARERLTGAYLLADAPPDGTPARYRVSGERYYLRADADETAVTALYRNAVWAAVLAARTKEGFDQLDYDALAEMLTLRSLTRLAGDVPFTEAQKQSFYAEAETAQQAVKLQAASLLLPYLYEDAGLDCAASQKAYVTKAVLLLIGCAALQFLFSLCADKTAAGVAAFAEKNVSERLLRAAFRFSEEEHRRFPPSHLRFLQQTCASQTGTLLPAVLRCLFFAPVLAAAGCALTFRKNALFGTLTLACAGAIVLTAAVLYAATYRAYYRMQHSAERYASHLDAVARQLFTVRADNAQAREERESRSVSAAIKKDESFVMRAVLSGLNLVSLLINFLTAAIFALGMNGLLDADLRVGDIVVCLQYASLTVTAFLLLGVTLVFAPKTVQSLKEIDDVLRAVPAAAACENNTATAADAERVVFDGVRLFPDSPEIRFTARRGTLTLLTGGAGTGKTLLIHALLREFTPAAGRILLDTADVAALSPAYPTDTVSYAGSRPVLFSASVRKNLELHGAAGTDDALLAALRAAECDFLVRDAADLDLPLQNAGELLSGGQRSRLSMAACFARKTAIYIFDDCMTAVNQDIRRRLLARISALRQDAIVLLVTQDPAEIPDADQTVIFSADGVTVRKGGVPDAGEP